MESAGESKQAISAVVKAYTESGVKKKVTSEPVGPTKDITDSSTETAPASPISSDSQQSDFDNTKPIEKEEQIGPSTFDPDKFTAQDEPLIEDAYPGLTEGTEEFAEDVASKVSKRTEMAMAEGVIGSDVNKDLDETFPNLYKDVFSEIQNSKLFATEYNGLSDEVKKAIEPGVIFEDGEVSGLDYTKIPKEAISKIVADYDDENWFENVLNKSVESLSGKILDEKKIELALQKKEAFFLFEKLKNEKGILDGIEASTNAESRKEDELTRLEYNSTLAKLKSLEKGLNEESIIMNSLEIIQNNTKLPGLVSTASTALGASAAYALSFLPAIHSQSEGAKFKDAIAIAKWKEANPLIFPEGVEPTSKEGMSLRIEHQKEAIRGAELYSEKVMKQSLDIFNSIKEFSPKDYRDGNFNFAGDVIGQLGFQVSMAKLGGASGLPLGVTVASFEAGYSMSRMEMYGDAIKGGLDHVDAARLADQYALISAPLEMIPIGGYLGKKAEKIGLGQFRKKIIDEITEKGVKNFSKDFASNQVAFSLKPMFKKAGVEFLEEGGQEAAQYNLGLGLAKLYNKDKEDSQVEFTKEDFGSDKYWKSMKENFILGGLAGAGIGGTMSVLNGDVFVGSNYAAMEEMFLDPKQMGKINDQLDAYRKIGKIETDEDLQIAKERVGIVAKASAEVNNATKTTPLLNNTATKRKLFELTTERLSLNKEVEGVETLALVSDKKERIAKIDETISGIVSGKIALKDLETEQEFIAPAQDATPVAEEAEQIALEEPTESQLQSDVDNGEVVTEMFTDENDIPDVYKNKTKVENSIRNTGTVKVGRKGKTNPTFMVTVEKSLADYHESTKQVSEPTQDAAQDVAQDAAPVVEGVVRDLPEGVTIEEAIDEEGEIDYELEEKVKEIARSRDLGITSDREIKSVAKDKDGNVIGGTFTSYDQSTGKYTFDVVLSEEYEGKGIGSNLLDGVKDLPYEIEEMNPDAEVEVDVVSSTMKSMLERIGFKVKEKIGADRFLMTKSEVDATPVVEGDDSSLESDIDIVAEEKLDDLPTFKRKLREMKVVQKDLKSAQEKLKNLIRAFIPSGPYGKNQVNTLVRIVEQATVKNYNNQVERIIKVIDHQREKSKKSLITKMVSFIKASSRNAKTKKGVRRSTGISAKGSSFFKSAKRVIENSMNQDFDKLDEAQKNIDDSLVESAIIKEQNGEPLTTKEQAAIDEALAYELFSGINDMSIEQVQEIFNDLKEKKSEFREEFKNRRIIKAEEVKQIKKEAKEQISKDYTLLYNEDGSRKGVDQLLKQRKEIWESFKKLKVWDGIKKWAGLYDFRTSRGFTDYMRNNIDHLGTLSNLLDKSGKFFTNNLYNALNKMYDNHWGGFFKQRDNLDVMVNSIDGIKGGYKEFISNLNPKNITLKGILTQGKNPTDYTVDTDEAMRIYALSKNDIQREKLLAMGFTDKKMDELKDHIGADAVTFADKVVEYLSNEYYESVNDVFKFINNTNLGQTENYFPTQTVSVEVNAKDLKDSSFKKIFDAETANALKDRIDLKGDIKLQGIRFTSTLENHFESMERFKSYAIGVQKIVALFESKDVNMLLDETGLKSAIKNSVNAMINPGSVIKQKQNFIDKFLSRFVRYALNFKVVQIAKQATSFVQAFEDYSFRGEGKQNVIIDLPMFMLEYAATIATLPSQYKKFKNLSPTFRKRMEEGLKGDIYGLETGQAVFKPISKKSTKAGSFLRGYQKSGAFGTVAGDALGVMGYMVNYNRDIANGIDEATALSNLNNYNATQQTRRGTEKSGIQLNPSTSSRVFTMFGSTLFLQINKVRSSTINITRSAMDGKAPKAKDVRALALNFAIANVLFTFMANIAKFIAGDEEDKEAGLQAVKDAGMGLSLLYQIPFIGSGVEAAMNKARGSRMPSSTVVNPFDRLFKDLYKAADEKDVLAGVKPIIELTIGAKIDPVIGLYNMYGGDFDDGMYDLVGISKSYKPGYGRKKPKQKTIEQLDAAYRSDQRKAAKGFDSGGYGKGKSKGFGTKGYD